MIIANQILKIICYIPSSFVSYYAMAKMLKIRRRWHYILGVTGLHILVQIFYTFALIYHVPGADALKLLAQTAVYLVGAIAFSKESVAHRFLALGIIYMSVVFGEMCSAVYFSVLGGHIDTHAVAQAAENPYIYVFIQALDFATVSALSVGSLHLWNRIVLHSRKQILWYFMLFPFSQLLLITFGAYYSAIEVFRFDCYVALTVGVLVSILADFFLLRGINAFSVRSVAAERAVWYEKLLEQQQGYYAQILADVDDASRIRHDIRNQLQTVCILVQQGENEAAQQQLDGLSNTLERSQQYCANRVVNAVLNVKAGQFETEGIHFLCHCDVPEDLSFAGVELCSLFSNVLDNAFNATKACTDTERTVELTAGTQGGFFILQCRNPYLPDKQRAKQRHASGHGLGLEILRDLAERHNGELKIQQDEHIFTCIIWLAMPNADPIPEHTAQAFASI